MRPVSFNRPHLIFCSPAQVACAAGAFIPSIFMSKTQSSKPIEIKISTVVAVSAIMRAHDLATLDDAMKKMTGGASDYFDHEFAVLDVGGCDFSESGIDWPAVIGLFRSYN